MLLIPRKALSSGVSIYANPLNRKPKNLYTLPREGSLMTRFVVLGILQYIEQILILILGDLDLL